MSENGDWLIPNFDRDNLWELFHEASKIRRFDIGTAEDDVVAVMNQLHESLPFDEYPQVALPPAMSDVDRPLLPTILGRTSGRQIQKVPVTILQLATLLHCAYGVTRRNDDGSFPRPFRATPSGGALYPLEIFLIVSAVENVQSGLYHYNVGKHVLAQLDVGDYSTRLASCLIQPEYAHYSSVVMLIAGFFQRSTFKYRDRGYRFALIEAGHIAQNLNIVAAALELKTLNVGGFYDQDLDRLLRLDGVTQSVLYVTTVGG